MSERVHVTDADGRWLYNRLVDDGSNVIRFHSGYGFVDRDQIRRSRWVVVPGWVPAEAWERLRATGEPTTDREG